MLSKTVFRTRGLSWRRHPPIERIKAGSQACLSCHSTPEAAPATMVALYGAQNGFGWKQGEVVGAQVVSIPLGVPFGRAYQALFWFMLALAATFVVIIIIDLLLRAL
jgi:Protein of unknown function (DUF3365)